MSNSGPCYYSMLGVRRQASASEIRDAYRKLALKWHPDRWMKDQVIAGEAKWPFQQIQEAYSVLSDKGKRTVYDDGLFGLLADNDDETRYSLEDLQGLLMDMMVDDPSIEFGFDWDSSQKAREKSHLR